MAETTLIPRDSAISTKLLEVVLTRDLNLSACSSVNGAPCTSREVGSFLSFLSMIALALATTYLDACRASIPAAFSYVGRASRNPSMFSPLPLASAAICGSQTASYPRGGSFDQSSNSRCDPLLLVGSAVSPKAAGLFDGRGNAVT